MKKCPYCAEEIQNEAIVCRYCKRDLSTLPSKPYFPPGQNSNTTGTKKSMGGKLILILLLFFGVIGVIGFFCLVVFLPYWTKSDIRSSASPTDATLLSLKRTGTSSLALSPTIEKPSIDTPIPSPTSTETLVPSQIPTDTPTPTVTVTSTPTDTSVPEVGMRENPVPMGQSFTLNQIGGNIFTITVIQVVRGEEAYQMANEANMFNGRPPEGRDYAMIYIRVEFIKGKSTDEVLSLDDSDFHIVSKNNILREINFVVPPQPEFSISLFSGGIGKGWVAKFPFADDTKPLLFYEEDYSPVVYFSLAP